MTGVLTNMFNAVADLLPARSAALARASFKLIAALPCNFSKFCCRCSSSIAVLAASGLIIRASAPRFFGSANGRCGSRANRFLTDLEYRLSILFSSAARACPVVLVTMVLMFCIPALTAFKPSESPKAVAAESSKPFAARLA